MQMHGLGVKDFENLDEAMKTADALIEDSAAQFGFVKETIPHDNPLLVKCFYIFSEGRRRSVTNSEEKRIEGFADLAKRGNQLKDASEVTGGTSIFDKPDDGDIKLEFPHFSDAKVEAEKNKSQGYTILELK